MSDAVTAPTQAVTTVDERPRRLPGAVIAALAYTLVTIVIFPDVLLHLSTTTLGADAEGDKFYFPWYFWHFKEAVLHGWDPAYTSSIFALYNCQIAVLEGTLFGATGGALTALFGPIAAYNLLVISSFPLAGLAVYMLAGEVAGSKIARFAAGFCYTFSTFHFFLALGHPQVLLEFMPLFAWRLLVFYRVPTIRNAVLAGVTLAVVPLFDVYLGAYFVLPFVLFSVVVLLVFDRRRFLQRPVMVGSAVIVVIAAVLTAYDAGGLLSLQRDVVANIAATSAGAAGLSADLGAFFLPSPFNPFAGAATLPFYEHMTAYVFPIEESGFLGYVALALAIAAMVMPRTRKLRRVWFWGAFAVLGILLALGPELRVFGHPVLPLPFYKLLYGWSALSSFRAPNRLVVIPLLSLAMLAAVALDALYAGLRTARARTVANTALAVGLLVTLLTNVVFGITYPSASVVVPPVYATIAADPSDVLLLDLPITDSFRAQFYQTVHTKRLVNGIATRYSPEMRASAESVPYVALFDVTGESGINMAGARNDVHIAKTDLAEQWTRRNIHYVVLHPLADPTSLDWARRFLTANLGVPAVVDDTFHIVVWHI